jgi:hypothetical protein
MASGALIAESLRLNASLERLPLEARKITRIGPLDDVSEAQPEIWTFIEFSVPDDQAPTLADELSAVLDAGGWYCDFRTEHETFVVFNGRVFRYARGDPSGRATAAAHARTVGVPEAQIDWPE